MSRNLIRYISLPLIIVLLMFTRAESQVKAKIEPAAEISLVVAGVANSLQKKPCMQLRISYHESSPEEYIQSIRAGVEKTGARAIDIVPEKNYTAWLLQRDSDFSMSVAADPLVSNNWHYQRLVSRQTNERYLQEMVDDADQGKNVYHIGSILPAGTSLSKGIWKQWDFMDPRYYGYFYGRLSYDDFLSKNLQFEKYQGETTIDGSRCMQIDLARSDTELIKFWFDIDHGFVLRRMQGFQVQDGRLVVSSEINISKVVEIDKLWIPTNIDYEHYLFEDNKNSNRADPAPVTTKRSVFSHILSITNLTNGCEFPPRSFVLDWPQGSHVANSIDGKKFTVSTEANGATPKISPDLPSAENDPDIIIGDAKPNVIIGTPALNFIVTDMNGLKWALTDLKGKKNLLITFFPKCFTGGCTNHLSSLRDCQKDFDAANTQILAVSVDPSDGARGQKAFSEKWGFKFPLIPDTTRNLCMLYGAVQDDKQAAARMSILIDKQGIVRYIDTNVHVVTHGADMLAKMRELGID